MKKKIIIHIGTHKTGTTSIQDALEESRGLLMEHGFLYPATNRDPWPELTKHTSVFSAARQQDPTVAQREREILLSEFAASECDCMIISEEGLSEPDPCYLDFFRPLTVDFDVRAVCYLRRQDLFVESLYNQFVRERARKEGRTINQFWKAPAIRNRLKYHTILQQWQDSGIPVTAIEFDAAVKSDGLLSTFLRAINASQVRLKESPSNKSPDMNLILALAKMNNQGLEVDLGSLMSSARVLNERCGFKSVKYLLGNNERVRLLEEFNEENSRLKAEYGISFSETLPAGEQKPPSTEPDINYLIALLAQTSLKKKI